MPVPAGTLPGMQGKKEGAAAAQPGSPGARWWTLLHVLRAASFCWPPLDRLQAPMKLLDLQGFKHTPETGAGALRAERAGGQPASVPRSVGRSSIEEGDGAARGTAGSSLPKSLARLSGFFRHDSRPPAQEEGARPVATH